VQIPPHCCSSCYTVWRCHEGGGLDSSSFWPNASNSQKTLGVALTTEFCFLKCSAPFSALHSAKSYRTNTSNLQPQC
jgi:hypothetical protein